MGKAEITERLEHETLAILSKRVYTFMSKPSIYLTANVMIVKHLSKLFKTGVYIGMNRPFKIIMEELE